MKFEKRSVGRTIKGIQLVNFDKINTKETNKGTIEYTTNRRNNSLSRILPQTFVKV